MRCALHPEVETGLRCGKCGQPICPRCLVHTPVGARCRSCAQLRRLPIYQVSFPYYLRAVGAGLGVALLGGGAWALLRVMAPFFYLYFILALGMGYATGELISRAVNRKRGLGLQVIAGAAMFLSFLVSSLLLNIDILRDPFGLLALALGIVMAVSRLR